MAPSLLATLVLLLGWGPPNPSCPCLAGGSWEGGMGHLELSGSAMNCVVPHPDPAFETFLPAVLSPNSN